MTGMIPNYSTFKVREVGLRLTTSISLHSSAMNQLYKGIKLEETNPLSICTGIKSVRGSPLEGIGIERCGGDVHQPLKIVWLTLQ